MNNLYMHTLDGKPAFYDGQQICYVGIGRKVHKFATSLKQIKSERIKSENWRNKQGFRDFEPNDYGHVLIPKSLLDK